MYKFKPQGNYVAATIIPQEEMTPGGIIIPEKAMSRPDMAEIIAVGEGIHSAFTEKLIPIPLEVGQKVIVSRVSYQPIKLPDGQELIIFQYGDIFGVIEEEDTDGTTGNA